MPVLPGVPMLPSVAVNVALSLVPQRKIAVRSTDAVTVFSPMHDEEEGARPALTSLLEQTRPAAQVVVSVNGGTDDTYGQVRRAIEPFGFALQGTRRIEALDADVEEYRSGEHDTHVTVVRYGDHTGKAESINHAHRHGVLAGERVVIVDGDTIFEPEFLARLDEATYELRFEDGPDGRVAVLEEHAVVSGGVMSYAPRGANAAQRFISAAREAEYAFSYVLRKGQAARVGGNPLTGWSRMFTLIGCGFSTRRDLLPMPGDTRTEDHDFTQAVQNGADVRRTLTRDELEQRGFRFVVDGREQTAAEMFDGEDRIELRRTRRAGFAERAIMHTQDPPNLDSLAKQLDRWHGGGQENFLKRLGAVLRPNVAFAVWLPVVETLITLTVVGILAAGMLLNLGNPSLGYPAEAVLGWVLLEIVAMTVLTIYGFLLYRRAAGDSWLPVLWISVRDTLRTVVPFTFLRYVNAIMYLASAAQVVPAFVRRRLRERAKRPDESGEDTLWGEDVPAAGASARRRALTGLSAAMVVALAIVAAGSWIQPVDRVAWRLVHGTPNPIDIEQYADVPVAWAPQAPMSRFGIPHVTSTATTRAADSGVPAPPVLAVARMTPQVELPPQPLALAPYCDPSFTPRIADTPRSFAGDAAAYAPLTYGELFTLARLVPLVRAIETAATAYAVPPEFFVQVLIHESYLDPLAVGPTGDRGLAQLTSDALTMLRGMSTNPGSKFYNPELTEGTFSVFDPEFSACAGAARLAWSMERAGDDRTGEAYALYVNPIQGLVRGRISETHQPLVDSMNELRPLVARLAAAFAAFADDPRSVAAPERGLLELAASVRSDETSMAAAYRNALAQIQEIGLSDELYLDVLRTLFDAHVSELSPS